MQSRPIREIRQQRFLELLREAGGPKELARLANTEATHLTAISKGRRNVGDNLAAKLERGMGRPAGWLDSLGNPSIRRQEFSQAHTMSQPESIVLPTTLDWGELMDRELPQTFSLVVRDDAMSPALGVGHKAIFAAGREPAPGQTVLLVDSDGHTYIRVYQARRPGHWQAVAHNAAYQPLDSITDGLRVLAVQIGALWG